MTTITKEWLQQTIAEFENTRDDIPFGLSDDDAKILIVLKRALVSLDAEPIGFRCRRNDNLGDWSYVYHREPDDFERKHLVIESIYAAPPVPVVPEEIEPDSNNTYDYVDGWNAAIEKFKEMNKCL